MSRVDPHFERIARRLTTLELRRSAPEGSRDNDEVDASDDVGDPGDAFVDTYSAAGLRTVLREYGLEGKLAALGLGDHELRITVEDPFRHRLEVVLSDGARIMDMRLHLHRVSLPKVEEEVDIVAVDWLHMQNPRAHFTAERPRLPGQRHPGTGLGRAVNQLLVLMCRRIGRDGLLTVPEHFHLAELYERAGYVTMDPASDRLLDEVRLAAPQLTLAARSWAMERGFVLDEAGAVVRYVPTERVLPVSSRLVQALEPGGFLWLQRLLEPRRRLRVDLAGLRASLRTDPVEGLDADV